MIKTERPEANMLTVTEAAKHCNVNPETVRRWAREEKVPASRVGSMLFFKAFDIDRMARGSAGRE